MINYTEMTNKFRLAAAILLAATISTASLYADNDPKERTDTLSPYSGTRSLLPYP